MKTIPFLALRFVLGLGLAAATLGALCQPPVAFQSPRNDQVVDDPSVVVSARVANGLDETGAELLVDGVDLLATLGAIPPFVNLSGVVEIGGVPVQVSELTWAEGASPGSSDTVSVRLTGLAPDSHLLELSALDASQAARSATRSFSTCEPLSLVLESWDAGGLAAGTQTLSLGKAASASLGAGVAGGVVPLPAGASLREGLPAGAAAFATAP